jgi:invasion protein IalB
MGKVLLCARIAICLPVMLALTTHRAMAQQPSQKHSPLTIQAEMPLPQSTTATYYDWVVRCELTSQRAERICVMSQGLQVPNQQGLAARIVLGRTARQDPVKLIVELPNGVWLPAGVTVFVGDKDNGIPLTFKTCSQGCLADVDLSPDLVRTLRQANGPARIEFEASAGTRAALPFSLRGFAPSLDASLAER